MSSDDVFWLEAIKHQGTSPFNPDPSYKVFRNVKDFGAKGDGTTDDSDAINQAISSGNRCGGGDWRSSTIVPAVVYFPRGTYLVKKAIIAYYYTQLIGDAKNRPVLLADESFNDMAVIDADPYIPNGGGKQWYTNQNNFFRSVRNFVIDVRRVPASKSQGTGIHWQVAQATSLMNIDIYMSTASDTAHQGIWMENGSGGFMGDLGFHGGKFGIWGGNQQFTVRNVRVENAKTAFQGIWNWGWTFQGIQIDNCEVGFDLKTGGRTSETQSVGSETILDAVVRNTPIFIRSSARSNGVLAGSLVLYNVTLENVPVAVSDGNVLLAGLKDGTTTIKSWGQGNIYKGKNSNARFAQGDLFAPPLPTSLLNKNGNVVGKMHPQYENIPVKYFVSVKDHGAKGDGKTDDTNAIEDILRRYARENVIFFDAGVYIVSRTINIPLGTRLVGEAWSVIAGRGSNFQDVHHPKVVVRVGERGSMQTGVVEITDILFSTVGPAPGAIVLEWNARGYDDDPASAGMWDSHIILGGRAGSNLESKNCGPGATPYDQSAAFMSLHLTRNSTAYLEGTWIWLADHDLDLPGEKQMSLYAARGVLSESEGPVWMIGTGPEHHTLYQYNLVEAKDHYIGFAQTESPYYQPVPSAPAPFGIHEGYNDPSFPAGTNHSWALRTLRSKDIHIFGAGFYSFFRDYSQDAIKTRTSQNDVVDIDSDSEVFLYNLNTVGVQYQISVDQEPVVSYEKNANGFADTVTFWRH
ncbi:glycoside hydrolase family 55 protein [Cylindrobasidium torrendii FP15055 ss-10]|uniref:Glycoside hydrolase family 55 protein n=1 Tax=Cylindrobasidium torrendii FP15055 ss-10 TaxID=1314674 RepID=A0A0D7B6R1_9AGAR|nr:glycoside hydrolase family 55 protein [Cylindrobasidium torrendii FP15055 ss-10]